MSSIASASGSWMDGSFAWGERTKYSGTSQDTPKCTPTWVKIIGVVVETDNASVCIYDRPSFRYGVYTKYIPAGYLSRWDSYFVVGKTSDQNMYVVDNMSYQRLPLEVAGSDDLHFNTLTMGFTNNHLLSYIHDFPSQLKMTDPFGQLPHYHLTEGTEQPFIPYNQSHEVITGAVGVSDNGEWMVAEVMNAGLIKIDTKTRKIQGFSNYAHRYGVGSDAHMTFRVTNNGMYVAAFDYNITPVIYSTRDSGCWASTDVYSDAFENKLRETTCPTDGEHLYEALSQKYSSYQVRSARAAAFNNDGDTLYFEDTLYEDENDWMNPTVYRTPLYASGYQKNEGIEYLALGDSFTSGEGDIEKKSDGSPYYLPGTENKNQCHLSERSYPFLLSFEKDIEPSRMQSVACSGAEILPDYMSPIDTYPGQGKRLAPLDKEVQEQVKMTSLTNFTPGNIPQLEFVKKYQPKTITLMGGGNDVGFGDILTYCASPTWEMAVVDDTCGYAVDGNPLQKMFAQTIASQYRYTLRLLQKIREASPDTTIYVIGYPSFISDTPGVDCFNSAALDSSERKMVNEGVTFMNTMLEDAATSMGVHYVDIQDTLEGGRLCEGSEYVTGVTNVLAQTYNHDTHELFHPNSKAHEKFAQRILAQGFQLQPLRNDPLAKPVDLTIPSYFGGAEQVQTKQQTLTNDSVTEQGNMVVYMSDGSLAPGTDASLTMFSNTINLGDVSVDGSGAVNASIALPSTLKPGRHVLVLKGHSPSGEPVQYFQFVTIISELEHDQDGDGTLDAKDPCLFITSWIDEATQKDVCAPSVSNEKPVEKGHVSASNEKPSSSQAKTRNSDEQKVDTSHVAVTEQKPSQNLRVVVRNPGDSENSVGDEEVTINPTVLGAHTTDGGDSKETEGQSIDWMILAGTIGLSTLLGGYGIVRAIKGKA